VSQQTPILIFPYNYADYYNATASTSNQFIDLKRYPDELLLVNEDATNIVFVKFDQASSATSGIPILASKSEKIKLRCRRIGVIASSGTPKLHVLALSYLDNRITA
jgi:hypothetical protein